MNMKQMNKEKLEMRRKQFEIPNGILALREQRNSRKENILYFMKLLGADQYGRRSEEMIRFLELECVGLKNRENLIMEIAQKYNKQIKTIRDDLAKVIVKVYSDRSNHKIFQELKINDSKIPNIREFSLRIVEYIQFVEREIPEEEMKVRLFLHALKIPQTMRGYEIFVRNIMDELEGKTYAKFIEKRTQQPKSTKAHNINCVLEYIWKNPANIKWLEKIWGKNRKYKPTCKEMIDEIRKYMEKSGDEKEFQTPEFLLKMKERNLSRKENICALLNQLNMITYVGYEELLQAIMIQCETKMAFEEMYQEILQSGKGKPVYNRIRSMIHKTWENQENQKKLKEMGLDFGGKIPTNREFVCTMVEYIKILESKSEREIRARNFLYRFSYLAGHEAIIETLSITEKEEKIQLEKEEKIQLEKEYQEYIAEMEKRKQAFSEYVTKLLEKWGIQDDPELLEWIGWDGIVIKTHKKQVFQGSSRPNKIQLIKAIVEYIKWLQEA